MIKQSNYNKNLTFVKKMLKLEMKGCADIEIRKEHNTKGSKLSELQNAYFLKRHYPKIFELWIFHKTVYETPGI